MLAALLSATAAPAAAQAASGPAEAERRLLLPARPPPRERTARSTRRSPRTRRRSSSSRSAELRAELAGLYARQDRAREALDTAEAALKIDPANREANRILGSVLAALGEQRQPFRPGDDPAQYRPRAIAALEKSRRDAGVDLNLELMLGRLYLQSRATTRSRSSAFAGSSTISRDIPEAAMLLAAAQDGAGRPDDAIARSRRSLEDNPAFFRGHVRLAELYDEQRRFTDAADVVRHARRRPTRASTCRRSRPSALINAGKPGEARDILQAALKRKTAPDAGAALPARPGAAPV